MPTLTTPYTFTSATTIVASEMNANFDAIATLLNGLLDATNLATGAVTENKIGTAAVTAAKIGTDAVTTVKIEDAAVTNAKVASGLDAVKVGAGSVSNTEFGYLDGVTSAIQTQLNAKLSSADGSVTPAKTSFAGDLGADGQIYFGYVKADGTSSRVPSGWTATRNTTGSYSITHNFGDKDYATILTTGDTAFGGSWNSNNTAANVGHGDNAFLVAVKNATVSVDGGFHFIVVRH